MARLQQTVLRSCPNNDDFIKNYTRVETAITEDNSLKTESFLIKDLSIPKLSEEQKISREG